MVCFRSWCTILALLMLSVPFQFQYMCCPGKHRRPFFLYRPSHLPNPQARGQSPCSEHLPHFTYFCLSYYLCPVALQLAHKVNISPTGFCPDDPAQCWYSELDLNALNCIQQTEVPVIEVNELGIGTGGWK